MDVCITKETATNSEILARRSKTERVWTTRRWSESRNWKPEGAEVRSGQVRLPVDLRGGCVQCTLYFPSTYFVRVNVVCTFFKSEICTGGRCDWKCQFCAPKRDFWRTKKASFYCDFRPLVVREFLEMTRAGRDFHRCDSATLRLLETFCDGPRGAILVSGRLQFPLKDLGGEFRTEYFLLFRSRNA